MQVTYIANFIGVIIGCWYDMCGWCVTDGCVMGGAGQFRGVVGGGAVPAVGGVSQLVVAMYTFQGRSAGELSFMKGDRLEVLSETSVLYL